MKYFRVTAVFLFSVFSVYAAQEIDLESAIDLALRQNRNLKLTEMSLDSRELSLAGTKVRFTTKIRPAGEASDSSLGDTLGVGVSAARDTTWGTTAKVSAERKRQQYPNADDYHRGSVKIELTQPLLRDLGPLVNREQVTQAEMDVMAAWRELELRKTDLIIQVVELYEKLVGLQRQIEFDRQTLKRLDKMVRLTRVREKQGRSTRVDLLRAELQYGEAQSRLSNTEERLGSTRADFADVLGFNPDLEFSALPGPIPQVDIGGPAEGYDLALCHRLDYAQVLQDCRDAVRHKRIARRNLLPDLDLITRYEQYGEGSVSSSANSLDKDSWFVGLAVGSDLFRRSERIQYKQSIVSESTAVQTLNIIRFALQRQVQQALLAYDQAQLEITLAQRNYELAENRAKLARKLYEMGKGDNFTATDAENALLQAQIKLVLAEADAVVESYKLLRTVGMLIAYPEELEPDTGNLKFETGLVETAQSLQLTTDDY